MTVDRSGKWWTGTSPDDVDTQWTPEAKAAYGQRLEELHAALAEHSALVMDRRGRESEFKGYFDSVDRLKRAAAAFSDAEFDLCGSFPLAIEVDEDDHDGEDEETEPWEPAAVLSAVGRWDFHLHDADALLAAGRQARQEAYPDESAEDRREAVKRPEQAAYEITHARGWDALIEAPGLALFVDSMSFIPQPDYQGMGTDPYAIVRFDD
ncbi:MAG TPA: hypothetical protein P5181_04710 [Dermatophilaceae bacterium]|nr:hypothetical protein [Dermatophilaceae bacterium]